MGRIFSSEQMQHTTQTAVISSSFWKRHFDNNPKVLGKTFNIPGVVSVVGAMPAGFAPFYGEKIDLWQPIHTASGHIRSESITG